MTDRQKVLQTLDTNSKMLQDFNKVLRDLDEEIKKHPGAGKLNALSTARRRCEQQIAALKEERVLLNDALRDFDE